MTARLTYGYRVMPKSLKKKMFSASDMLRFGRYIAEGRSIDIRRHFRSWYDGPVESGRQHTYWS